MMRKEDSYTNMLNRKIKNESCGNSATQSTLEQTGLESSSFPQRKKKTFYSIIVNQQKRMTTSKYNGNIFRDVSI